MLHDRLCLLGGTLLVHISADMAFEGGGPNPLISIISMTNRAEAVVFLPIAL